MEQNELLLRKLQTNPEYREFQDIQKIDALGVLLCGIFCLCAIAYNIIRAVHYGLSVRHDVVLMSIVLACLIVFIGSVFTTFAQKEPVFVTEGVIKEVQPKAYRSMKANWYLVVSDDNNQEYWGTSPSLFFHDWIGRKSFAVGEKVLCFSMGGEKWIISE